MDISLKLKEICDNTRSALSTVKDSAQLSELKVKILGKKGALTDILRSMGDLPAEDRPKIGALVNDTRKIIEDACAAFEAQIKEKERQERFLKEAIDVTMPGIIAPAGKLHPLTQVLYELRAIFIGMGFEVKEGPEIEYDKYNFEMLNIPKDHPARDMQDTFYVDTNVVLRTHTSPVQVRTMLEQKPPIRMICPGRVYRSDDVDATHSPIFLQMDGLGIDKGITMSDLNGVLAEFAKELYGQTTKTRMRPSYFPFTEPSAEVDISCSVCGGTGCRVCKNTGWIEILGAGMVHPNVLKMCGIDPEVYSGFAFGMGIDRISNMKYGITDIRLLYENDKRFLAQF